MTVRGQRPAATVELTYEGETILVQSDDVVVGRTSKCTVRVVHPLVSREHCRIEPREDGLFVVDLQSINGTWLNGERVETRTRARAGDRIGLGREGAVLVVNRAVVGGVDVSRLPREEDQQTMVAGDPRAAGKVARVEVAPEALPSLGAPVEPTTRAANDAEKAARAVAAGDQSIPVASAIQTNEIGDDGPTTGEAGVAAPASAPARSGFAPGFVVGLVVGLAVVAALAKFTHALDAVRARPDEARGR
jgi:pSer/pThr/pTyr-binding forkhead associated (FHA) protein